MLKTISPHVRHIGIAFIIAVALLLLAKVAAHILQ